MHFSFISNWNWKREEIRKKYWFWYWKIKIKSTLRNNKMEMRKKTCTSWYLK
jgi:hypothetical protein